MRVGLRSNSYLKFLFSAGFLYLLFYLLYQFVLKRYSYYDQRFIGFLIESADVVLHWLGYQTFLVTQDRDMQVIGIDGSNGVWVGSNCNAITLFGLFSVFILAYPGNQKDKFWFIPLGLVLIHFLNIFRVVALAMIARHSPAHLDFNHTYTFTFLVYGFIFGLWMWWVNRFASRGLSTAEESTLS